MAQNIEIKDMKTQDGKSVKNRLENLKDSLTRVRDKSRFIYNFFNKNGDILDFAAGLSYYTIFAIIPLSLIVFTILLRLPSLQDKILDVRIMILENVIPTNAEFINGYLDKFLEDRKSVV